MYPLHRFALGLSSWLVALVTFAPPARADLLAASFGPNFFDGSVVRLDDATGAPLPGGIPTGSGGMGLPQGVTIGPDGNVYVTSSNPLTGAGEVLYFDGATGAPLPSPHVGERDGLFGTLPFNPPAEENGDPVPSSPARLTFGADGNLYVADMAGTAVRKFDGTTGELLEDAATGLAGPTGLAFGPDGALYVGSFNSASIDRVVNGTNEPFIVPGASPLFTPSALLFLPGGDLLVVDLIGNQLLRYDSNGNYVPSFDTEQNPVPFAVIPPEIPDPLPPGANFPSNNPSDIMFDVDGNLLVSVLGITYPPETPGAILRYDLDGNLLGTVIDNHLGIGALTWIASPDAVVGDYDGNGSVEAADYDKWKADFGRFVAAGGGADGNSNGIVDAADFTVWRDVLGLGAEAAPSDILAVPEPSSLLLALLAAVAVLRNRAAAVQLRPITPGWHY